MGRVEREIRLLSGAQTNIGQIRENNEDNVRLWEDDTFVVAAVADGMGGAVAGEEASRIAVDAIKADSLIPGADRDAFLAKLNDDYIIDKLCDTVRSANIDIVRKAIVHPELRGMGTTFTLAFVRSNSAIVAHVGDSRAYLVDGVSGGIKQITADHSFVEALVAAGHITAEQAKEHPMRNVLYRALGQHEDIEIDVYETDLHAKDRLVLCSDGLTRHVEPDEIARIARENDDPQAIADALIELANARGGEDNVSVIAIILDGESETQASNEALEDTEDTLVFRTPTATTLQGKSLFDNDDDTLQGLHLDERNPRTSDAEGRDVRKPEP